MNRIELARKISEILKEDTIDWKLFEETYQKYKEAVEDE